MMREAFVFFALQQSARAHLIESGAIERFRDDPDAENRLPGFVEQLHLPFGVFCELPRNAARHVRADGRHLFPGCITIGALRPVFGRA